MATAVLTGLKSRVPTATSVRRGARGGRGGVRAVLHVPDERSSDVLLLASRRTRGR
jgi:hypothetical protein